MIVLDASAVLELLLLAPGSASVRARLEDPEETLHAPHILDLEVAQVLRRYNSTGAISPERAHQAMSDFLALGVIRYPHEPMLHRIWALRNVATAYDAAYLVLAETLASPLLTFDARLARTRGHKARIELLV